MNDAIRDDVQAEIDAFVACVRSTFDPTRYPHLADGDEFDAALVAVNREFATLQRVFHDYLMASWSEEAAAALRGTSAPPTAGREPGQSKGRA
jgi:hypothetical protein